MTDIKSIGVLAHPSRPDTHPVAREIAHTLCQRGIKHWVHTAWDEGSVQRDVARADVVMAIGGDGAMLRAARVCAEYRVPVLGINMGWLGFLTEIEKPADCEAGLDKLLAGDYWIEKRMMLQATVLEDRRKPRGTFRALNDVVISGSVFGRMVQIAAYIDKHWATTYNADALIMSTPTGSTAYALATGGPILPPELRNILLVPMAPHLSMDRPIVLSQGAVVDIEPTPENRHNVVLTVDGRVAAELGDNQHICVTSAAPESQFVRLRERNYFYRSLLDRMEPRINRHGPRRMTF
ncbi:MAG: NAD(+)/NADH kinase [Chloroflexi bacterium]|nr:NAD(+)/NADH kinase [Chloroflexota bacterium]